MDIRRFRFKGKRWKNDFINFEDVIVYWCGELVDQEQLHRELNSKDPKVRGTAVFSLSFCIKELSDNEKKRVFKDLHRLTSDEDSNVLYHVVQILKNFFEYVPDKKQAWEDLVRMALDEDSYVREDAAILLKTVFQHVPDKKQVWEDLVRLTSELLNSTSKNRNDVYDSLSQINDKHISFLDSVNTPASDKVITVLLLEALGSVYQYVPDKKQAWKDLVKMALFKDSIVGWRNKKAIEIVLRCIPDKKQAWENLVRLVPDEDSNVILQNLRVLSVFFEYLPNKNEAWEYLFRQALDEDSNVRFRIYMMLDEFFKYLPDKNEARNDLARPESYEGINVISLATSALLSTFFRVPDEEQAWNDLHGLTYNEDSIVRRHAVSTLGSVFSQVPDEEQAWNDLHRVTNDEDKWVRKRSVYALGSAFPRLPDKQQAWDDLHRMTNDKDSDVRVEANYSLGKVSIFKASQAEKEEDYKRELENAIEFFEKAAQESIDNWSNPAQFYLPFYRLFHTIVFKKQYSKEEIDKYLAEAKEAIKGSKSKKLLLEAVENLAESFLEAAENLVETLKEAQNLENLDLEPMKAELNYYIKYIDRPAELTMDIEGTAYFAAEAIRKGLPILDRNLKELLEEIQEKAKIACKESKGTATEEIVCTVNREVQGWKNVTPEEIAFNAENILIYIKSKVPPIPENEHIFEKIKEIESKKDTNLLLRSIRDFFEELPKIMIDPERMKPTIGIITALPKEYAAVNVLLENKNDKYNVPGSGAGRRYCLGEIPSEEGTKHSLVLANAGMGNNNAAAKAAILLEHFSNVKAIIMVGIAGGVPNIDKIDDHVRLGDIVVSNEYGVIQYDNIKKETQRTIFRNPPRPPCASLLEAAKYLEAGELLGNRPWEKYIDQALSRLGTFRPSEDRDVLHSSDNQKEIVKHPDDIRRIKDQPRIFIGPIASANTLQKDPKARDELHEKFGVKAIEMEASGIADAAWNREVGYLVIRGICDYCDSHKNDDWQQYAAVVAAAYMRALIESMP